MRLHICTSVLLFFSKCKHQVSNVTELFILVANSSLSECVARLNGDLLEPHEALKVLQGFCSGSSSQDGSSLGSHYVEIIIAVPLFNLPEESKETPQRPFFVGDMGAFQIQTSNFRWLFVCVCVSLLHWFHILEPTPAQPAAFWCFSVAHAAKGQ